MSLRSRKAGVPIPCFSILKMRLLRPKVLAMTNETNFMRKPYYLTAIIFRTVVLPPVKTFTMYNPVDRSGIDIK